MLYYIFQYLDKAFDVPGAGVFQYITFLSEDSFKKVKKQITNAMIDLLGSPLEHLSSADNYFTKMKSMVNLASELKIDETLICAKEIGEENLGKKFNF